MCFSAPTMLGFSQERLADPLYLAQAYDKTTAEDGDAPAAPAAASDGTGGDEGALRHSALIHRLHERNYSRAMSTVASRHGRFVMADEVPNT